MLMFVMQGMFDLIEQFMIEVVCVKLQFLIDFVVCVYDELFVLIGVWFLSLCDLVFCGGYVMIGYFDFCVVMVWFWVDGIILDFCFFDGICFGFFLFSIFYWEIVIGVLVVCDVLEFYDC